VSEQFLNSNVDLGSLSASTIPVPVVRKGKREALPGTDEGNCLPNRLRTACAQTDLYEEPQHATWGINGAEADAIEACMPTPPPQQQQMRSCTHCHCQLTWEVTNSVQRGRRVYAFSIHKTHYHAVY